MLQSHFCALQSTAFNSIVVKTPALPNYNFEFVPAHRLFLLRRLKNSTSGDIINFQHIFGEPAENIMTFFCLYVLKYNLQSKVKLYAALSIAINVLCPTLRNAF